MLVYFFFFFSSRRRHTRFDCDWSSDVCSSDLGKITARAVTTETRAKDLPEVPTMIESGLPQLTVGFSAGILAPAGTPAAIVARLNGEINEAMKSPELAAAMAKLGFEPMFWTPEQ